MKILVTGANGFLGSWVAKGLAKRGHQLRVLHRRSSDMQLLDGVEFESVLGDVTDLESIVAATQAIDAVFHLAALIAYDRSEYEKMDLVNVGGTKNIIQACLKNKVKRLVHTSSTVTIGASAKPLSLNENSPYEMAQYNFGYYESKRKAEAAVLEASAVGAAGLGFGLDAVVVNPSIMFGPGDGTKSSRRLHLKVAQGKIPFYPCGGVNILDVEDAVEGHLLAFEKGRSGERYILGGENITVKEMFQWLAEFGGHRAPFIQLPTFLLRSPFYFSQLAQTLGLNLRLVSDSIFLSTLYHWYDISKSRDHLGYRPRSAKSAVGRSVHWCFTHGLLVPPQ